LSLRILPYRQRTNQAPHENSTEGDSTDGDANSFKFQVKDIGGLGAQQVNNQREVCQRHQQNQNPEMPMYSSRNSNWWSCRIIRTARRRGAF
jgi:hypothetical protein